MPAILICAPTKGSLCPAASIHLALKSKALMTSVNPAELEPNSFKLQYLCPTRKVQAIWHLVYDQSVNKPYLSAPYLTEVLLYRMTVKAMVLSSNNFWPKVPLETVSRLYPEECYQTSYPLLSGRGGGAGEQPWLSQVEQTGLSSILHPFAWAILYSIFLGLM